MGYREINDSWALDSLSVTYHPLYCLQSDAIALLFVFLFFLVVIHAMHLLLFYDMYAYILFAVLYPTIDALFIMCILTKLGVQCASM